MSVNVSQVNMAIEKTDCTVLTKNQPLLIVSWSKKKSAPARACLRKSPARVAIHLNMENPAAVLRTNKAIACWRKRPTITVGLGLYQRLFCKRRYINSPRYFSPILGGNIEPDLENEKTENINSTISKCSSLRKGIR